MKNRKQIDPAEFVRIGYRYIRDGRRPQADYQHVIVDEVQDLSELGLKLLHGLVGDTIEVVRTVAARHGVTMSQVALQWVMSRPEVTVAISGADSDAQMAENLGALTLRLTDEDLAELEAVSALENRSVT